MDDAHKIPVAQQKAPTYFNPHSTVQDAKVKNPLLKIEPPEKNPAEVLKKKYPIKIIAGIAILIVTVLAIPVGLYLNQRPTSVFIEATATPTPTPTPTETPSENN